MSEKLFRFLVKEIAGLRVICKSCTAVMEVSIRQLANQTGIVTCPMCNKPVQKDANQHVANLAKALLAFAELDYVDVEISLPITD